MEFDPEVSLNRLLIEHNLAGYFPELFKLDLEAKSTRKIAPRFTSICGPGPAPGAKVLDDSVDFSRTDPEELESKFVMSMLDTTESTRPPPDLDFHISAKQIHTSYINHGNVFFFLSYSFKY